jgi:hypothetical protein
MAALAGARTRRWATRFIDATVRRRWYKLIVTTIAAQRAKTVRGRIARAKR